jgi:integrase
MIADVLALYGREVAAERASRRNLGYNISNLLKWWGDKRTSDISKDACKEYAKTKTAPAASADLKILKAATTHWHGSKFGPLLFTPSFWRPADNDPKDRYLTKHEAARLLRAAKPYRHLRRLILLQLYTGSRPGVILAMTWAQIDLKSGTMMRKPRGAIEHGNKRAPKVRLGRRITAHLKRWKKMDGAEKLVCRFEDKWHPGARQVEDPHGTWSKVIRAAGLEGVTRHTLRHTRATWMMQAGVPIWEAAGFLGMSIKTLERVYAHHDPSHQERAANI